MSGQLALGPARPRPLAAADRLTAPHDPVGALRRLTARYTPARFDGHDYAMLDPAAWRTALAEYHALLAASDRARLPFPECVVLAHLHNLALFHEHLRQQPGPMVPLYLFDYATRTARALPHPGLHRAA